MIKNFNCLQHTVEKLCKNCWYRKAQKIVLEKVAWGKFGPFSLKNDILKIILKNFEKISTFLIVNNIYGPCVESEPT